MTGKYISQGNHAYETSSASGRDSGAPAKNREKCSVEELAQYFDTTGTTIRKDLVILENAGTVIRTYGGVVLNKEESDPPIDHKTLINTHKKALIAAAAVKYIHDGDSIILDAGSTVLQMVPLLSRFSNITVMTNSLHIVNALSELDNEQTILMPGGTFRKKSASFHGQLAENGPLSNSALINFSWELTVLT